MRKMGICILVVASMLMFCLTPANATLLTFDLGNEFSGATPPSGDPPWLRATFDDSYGTNMQVMLTMDASDLTGFEFVTQWYFNFDPVLNSSQLTIAHNSGTEAISVDQGNNGFKADGDGLYDFVFNFETDMSSADRFSAGNTSVYVLSYTSSIDVTSFNVLSEPDGGNGPFPTAAKVQGISDESCPMDNPNCESGWVTVPEMQSVYLLGITLGGLVVTRRKINHRNKA